MPARAAAHPSIKLLASTFAAGCYADRWVALAGPRHLTKVRAGAVVLARKLVEKGFEIAATDGTAKVIADAGLPVKRATQVREGRPHIVDMIKNDEFAMIVNTTEGKTAIRESNSIRREAVHKRITYYTTLAGALATCEALEHLDAVEVNRLQDLHSEARS